MVTVMGIILSVVIALWAIHRFFFVGRRHRFDARIPPYNDPRDVMSRFRRIVGGRK